MIIIRPSQGIVSQLFGENPSAYKQFGFPGHEGIDFAGKVGDPVFGSFESIVTLMNYDQKKAYGIHIRAKCEGYEAVYAHLSQSFVKVGDIIKPGQLIGRMGSTGNSTGPHLHFTLLVSGKQTKGYPAGVVDPMLYFNEEIKTDDKKDLKVLTGITTVACGVNMRPDHNVATEIYGHLETGVKVEVLNTYMDSSGNSWAFVQPPKVWVAIVNSGNRYLNEQ